MYPNTENYSINNSNNKNNVKLYINNTAFYNCQKENGKIDPMCISDIYTIGNYGYPIDQNTSNKNILYTRTFEKSINNKRIVSCPTNYKPCGNNICCYHDGIEIKKCLAAEHSTILGSPYPHCNYNGETNLFVNGTPNFQSEKQCLNWCANHPDCNAVVKYLDRNGNLQCRYYIYDTQDNRIKTVEDKTAKIYDKRKYKYVANPSERILPKYDYNLVTDDNILDGCIPFGCCADGTKKANKDGTNCSPFTPKSRLVGDPNDKYKFSSLGGITKLGKINKLSGNAYINYA